MLSTSYTVLSNAISNSNFDALFVNSISLTLADL
jgi:hypothetical protein